MIDVVIPTLMKIKPENFAYSIKQAVDSEYVNKIIIIDNSCGKFTENISIESDKIVLLEQKENIFVNPAWNIGVALSTADNILIMNDDVLCSKEVYRQVCETIDIKTVGLCSVQSRRCKNIEEYSKYLQDFGTHIKTTTNFDSNTTNNKTGWFFCIKKKLWKDIPRELLFFYGDDLIYDRIRNVEYLTKNISSCKIGHVGSYTVNKNNNIKKILIQEHKIYQKEKIGYIKW